jgi:hypothetical protein
MFSSSKIASIKDHTISSLQQIRIRTAYLPSGSLDPEPSAKTIGPASAALSAHTVRLEKEQGLSPFRRKAMFCIHS